MSVSDPTSGRLEGEPRSSVERADPSSPRPGESGAATVPADTSFRTLVQTLRTGDEDQRDWAARILHDRYYEPIRIVVAQKARRHPRLKRLTETGELWDSLMIVLLDKNVSLDHVDPKALLLRIANNNVINKMKREMTKKRGGHVHRQSIDDAALVPDHGLSPSEQVSRDELIELLSGHREKLSESEQMVIKMKLEGLEWEAIGKLVGKSKNAARMEHHRALDKLRKAVGEGTTKE